MRYLSYLLIAGFLACLAAVPLVSGQDLPPWKYSVLDLGTLPGNTYSEGLSINIWGHVVGCSGDPRYTCDNSGFTLTDGFLWTKRRGLKTLKPLPGGMFAYGNAINDSDWVAGSSSGTAFQANLHAAVWTGDGRVLDLGTLDKACYDTCNSYGMAISGNGRVVGGSDLPARDISHAFLWTEDSGMIDLGSGRFALSYATAVNLRAGVAGVLNTLATGTNAFLWTPREGMRDLGTLKGATEAWSVAFGINDFNEVVGQSAYDGGDFHYFHAFLWTRDKGMQDLGILGRTPNSSGALAISDNGEIVGWSGDFTEARDTSMGNLKNFIDPRSGRVVNTGNGVVIHAFIWSRDKGMQDLNNFIDSKSGWVLVSANAINTLGQITGSGIINGEYHAFLLTLRNR
jgi:probable HAF family extracellular repeat protein